MSTTYGNFQPELQNRGLGGHHFLKSEPHQTSGTLHYFPGRACPTTKNDYKQGPGTYSQQNYGMLHAGLPKRDALVLAESIDDDLLTRLCYAMGLDKLYHLPELNRLTDFLDGM